jgi:small subunit ribosomal protein S31
MSGLEEEQNVAFYSHVLLDHLLEGFPDKGPVRQFTELVLIGLLNNPYITVERKDATVQYYREYFKQKEDVLRASGALG